MCPLHPFRFGSGARGACVIPWLDWRHRSWSRAARARPGPHGSGDRHLAMIGPWLRKGKMAAAALSTLAPAASHRAKATALCPRAKRPGPKMCDFAFRVPSPQGSRRRRRRCCNWTEAPISDTPPPDGQIAIIPSQIVFAAAAAAALAVLRSPAKHWSVRSAPRPGWEAKVVAKGLQVQTLAHGLGVGLGAGKGVRSRYATDAQYNSPLKAQVLEVGELKDSSNATWRVPNMRNSPCVDCASCVVAPQRGTKKQLPRYSRSSGISATVEVSWLFERCPFLLCTMA